MGELSLPEFADRMNEVMPVVIKEFARRQLNQLYRGQITLPQFFALAFLQKEGESKMTDLAHFLHVTTAATTGIVDRLVRDGYVIRESGAEDRRIIKIRTTAKGNELVKKVNEQRKRMIINIFGRISGKDRKDYLRIILQIKEILLKENQG